MTILSMCTAPTLTCPLLATLLIPLLTPPSPFRGSSFIPYATAEMESLRDAIAKARPTKNSDKLLVPQQRTSDAEHKDGKIAKPKASEKQPKEEFEKSAKKFIEAQKTLDDKHGEIHKREEDITKLRAAHAIELRAERKTSRQSLRLPKHEVVKLRLAQE